MRTYPAAIALSLAAALTTSAALSAPPPPLAPKAASMVETGRTALATGDSDAAVDAFESALTLQPGHITILLQLAEATRRQGMQGKALHYYREALKADPQNVAAISGEGAALVEKGAVEKARRNLTRLETLCGSNCEATRQLAAAIARGPAPKIVTADQVKPVTVVTEN